MILFHVPNERSKIRSGSVTRPLFFPPSRSLLFRRRSLWGPFPFLRLTCGTEARLGSGFDRLGCALLYLVRWRLFGSGGDVELRSSRGPFPDFGAGSPLLSLGGRWAPSLRPSPPSPTRHYRRRGGERGPGSGRGRQWVPSPTPREPVASPTVPAERTGSSVPPPPPFPTWQGRAETRLSAPARSGSRR